MAISGSSQALNDKVSLNHVVTQVGGTASLISSDHLRQQADAFPPFRSVLTKYDQFFLAQVQQHVACNAAHNVQARTCKWLLRMHELIGPDLLVDAGISGTDDGSDADHRVDSGRRATESRGDYISPGSHSYRRPCARYKTGPANATRTFALITNVSSVQMKNSFSRSSPLMAYGGDGGRRATLLLCFAQHEQNSRGPLHPRLRRFLR
jgi:hypothetical protein